MKILFIRYNYKTIQNEDTFYQILFRKNDSIKLILKCVTHKINRINNFVVVKCYLIFYFLLFILCILLLGGCKHPLVLMLVVVSAP